MTLQALVSSDPLHDATALCSTYVDLRMENDFERATGSATVCHAGVRLAMARGLLLTVSCRQKLSVMTTFAWPVTSPGCPALRRV